MRKQNPTEAVSDDDLQEWIQELVVGASHMETPEQAAKDALSIFTVYWVASQTGDKEEMQQAETALSEGDLYYKVRVECMRRLKRMRAVVPNAWKLFMSLLQQRCLPATLRSKVEQAVRFWSRKSVVVRPKQRGRVWEVEAEAKAYISALEEIRRQITTAKEAYATPTQCATSEQAKDLRMEVGPFTLVNSGGFSKAFMQGSADSLGQAVVLLEKNGLGFVCYGEAHMTNRVARSSVAAQYIAATDTFLVRGFKKGTHETVAYMIHELGHRLIDKFMSKETKNKLFAMYREANTASYTRRYSSEDVEKYLPQIGDTYVQGRKVLEVTKVMPTRIYLKLQGYVESPSFHIAPEAWAENARMKAGVIPDFGFVNKYSRTNEEENFCEMLRFYCMGKLPPTQAALIEPVLQQAIKDAKALPSRNPAKTLDEQVDIWLASGYLRVDPLKYRTLFAKHASEIGQPEPVGEMLGCGGFGCVWPTTQSGVAMKATKDESEPVIVQMLMRDKKAPAGFARYTHMSSVDGFTLLWREEVDPYQGKDFLALYEYQLYSQTAHEIFEWAESKDEWAELVSQLGDRMADWDAKPGKSNVIIVPVLVDGKLVDLENWEPSDDLAETMGMRFILAWQAARHVATQLRKNKELKGIADAILWAMSKGIMLCDVTSVNLGYVKRGTKKQLVIYDPGHTVNVPPTERA